MYWREKRTGHVWLTEKNGKQLLETKEQETLSGAKRRRNNWERVNWSRYCWEN